MQIELSPNAQAMLASLMPDGGDPAPLVEYAISELVEQRNEAASFVAINPQTGEPLTDDQLRAEIQKGLDDIDAGRVAPLDVEELKRRGRERLAARKQVL